MRAGPRAYRTWRSAPRSSVVQRPLKAHRVQPRVQAVGLEALVFFERKGFRTWAEPLVSGGEPRLAEDGKRVHRQRGLADRLAPFVDPPEPKPELAQSVRLEGLRAEVPPVDHVDRVVGVDDSPVLHELACPQVPVFTGPSYIGFVRLEPLEIPVERVEEQPRPVVAGQFIGELERELPLRLGQELAVVVPEVGAFQVHAGLDLEEPLPVAQHAERSGGSARAAPIAREECVQVVPEEQVIEVVLDRGRGRHGRKRGGDQESFVHGRRSLVRRTGAERRGARRGRAEAPAVLRELRAAGPAW